jgi:hypothetical protein
MSRDIFIQDIPAAAKSPGDIPDHFVPQALPFRADHVRSVISALRPDAAFGPGGSGTIEGDGIDIDLQIADEDPLESFALFDRSSDRDAADRLITLVLSELGVRAFDMDQDDGMFRPVS